MRYLLLFALACSVASCQPSINTIIKKTYPPLGADQPIRLIELQELAPVSAAEIGEVAIKDGGFATNCSWDTVIAKAKLEARKMGGNVVKITDHTKPSLLGSSCHQIVATIFREDSAYAAKIASGEITVMRVVDATPQVESSKLRIGVSGGFSYLTGTTPENLAPEYEEHVSDMKSGKHFAADFSYFLSENIGIGLIFEHMLTRAETENVIATDLRTGEVVRGRLVDDITMNYIGPTISGRFLNKSGRTRFNFEFSIGYLGYTNDAVIIEPVKLTSSTVSVVTSLGIELAVSKPISIRLGATLFVGTLKEYDFTSARGNGTIQLKEEQYENVSHLDISAGLRWSL